MANYKPLSARVVFEIEDLWLEWVEETGMTQELATEEDYLAFVKYTREQRRSRQMKECPDCMGNGTIDYACGGTGTETLRCETCEGTGEIEDEWLH